MREIYPLKVLQLTKRFMLPLTKRKKYFKMECQFDYYNQIQVVIGQVGCYLVYVHSRMVIVKIDFDDNISNMSLIKWMIIIRTIA